MAAKADQVLEGAIAFVHASNPKNRESAVYFLAPHVGSASEREIYLQSRRASGRSFFWARHQPTSEASSQVCPYIALSECCRKTDIFPCFSPLVLLPRQAGLPLIDLVQKR
jgi:hypothetical protein